MSNTYGVVEKKVLYALIDLADSDGVAYANTSDIAQEIGYKSSGGAITWALRLLMNKNKITKLSKNKYKVLV